MSKIILKTIGYSIIPAALIVTVKFLSIFALISIKGIDFSLHSTLSGLFSVEILFKTEQDAIFVNSISNLIVFLVIGLNTLYLIFKKSIFKSALESPRTIVKLTKLNLLGWISKDKTDFFKIIIWTLFTWIITGLIISQSLSMINYMWIGILSGTVSLLSAILLLNVYENEANRIYPDNNKLY